LRLTIHAQHASLLLHYVFFLRTIRSAPMFCVRAAAE
jgi:hypothetical protein